MFKIAMRYGGMNVPVTSDTRRLCGGLLVSSPFQDGDC